ncbi:MAG: hypothetical protein ACREEW_01615 [Caulobacteraceae bacterium]
MKSLVIAAALILAPAAASAADLSGVWTVNGDFSGMIKYTLTCTLTQTPDGKLSGPCKGAEGAADQSTGSVSGSAVDFAYDTTYQGGPVHLDYKGQVQPDGSLKGTVDAGGPQGTFTATKRH